jgi:hypothetical protein
MGVLDIHRCYLSYLNLVTTQVEREIFRRLNGDEVPLDSHATKLGTRTVFSGSAQQLRNEYSLSISISPHRPAFQIALESTTLNSLEKASCRRLND